MVISVYFSDILLYKIHHNVNVYFVNKKVNCLIYFTYKY